MFLPGLVLARISNISVMEFVFFAVSYSFQKFDLLTVAVLVLIYM